MHSEIVKFYSNVIDDFIGLVEKDYKGKNILTNDQIEKIKKSLKQKIKEPSNYHKQIISNFYEKSLSLTNQQNRQEQNGNNSAPKNEEQKQQAKCTQKDKQKEKLISQDNPSLKVLKSVDEDEDDDLNQFKKNQSDNSHLIKQEDHSKQQQNKSQPYNLYEFSSDDDDEKLTPGQLTSIKEKTGIHILGSYNTKQKKFNSKKEETKLTVYNALLKIDGHDHELLFPVVQIVAKRVSKVQLNL